MRLKTSLLAMAVTFGTLTYASASLADDLLQIYDAARSYDPVYKSAQKAYDAALQRLPLARAGTRPNAGLSASTTWTNLESKTGALDLGATSNTTQAGLAGSMPLFRPANVLAVSQAEIGVRIAEAQRMQAEQDLILRVARAYFDTLAAQDTLAVTRAQKQAVAEQLAAAKRNFEVGTSTITDSREAQARFDLNSAQEIAADNDLAVKRTALRQLIGKEPPALKPLAAKPQLRAVEPTSIEVWAERAEGANLAVKQALDAEQVAGLEVKRAKAAEGPTVDLNANYGLNRSSRSLSSPLATTSRSASIGVSVSYPLYSGGATQARIAEALALEEKSRNDALGAKASAGQGARQAFLGTRSGLAQIKALEAAELSSQSALDANKLGYQVGVRINIDVLNSQAQLFQTKRDLSRARYELLLSTLQLESVVGDLTREDLAQTNALLVDAAPVVLEAPKADTRNAPVPGAGDTPPAGVKSPAAGGADPRSQAVPRVRPPRPGEPQRGIATPPKRGAPTAPAQPDAATKAGSAAPTSPGAPKQMPAPLPARAASAGSASK